MNVPPNPGTRPNGGRMKPVVYLADLRYNYIGVLANDTAPLGVGYMKAVMDRDWDAIDSRLFVYPDKLLSAKRQTPPDVLMVSNYVWNESLSLYFGKIAKQVRPETLMVMGGPNICSSPNGRSSTSVGIPNSSL